MANKVTQIVKRATQFLTEVRTEMSKVVWPSYAEFIGSTMVVLLIVCAFSIYLGAIDVVLSKVAEQIFVAYGMR